MPGPDRRMEGLFSYVSCESRVPAGHPLRLILTIADAALVALSGEFQCCSLALKGRCFHAWAEIERTVERATAYWNDHKHSLLWGRRRRHRQPRHHLGIATVPKITLI